MKTHIGVLAIAFILLCTTVSWCPIDSSAQTRAQFDRGVEWVDDYFLNLSPDARVIDYPYVYTKVDYGLQLSRIIQDQDSLWLEDLDLVSGLDHYSRDNTSFAVGEDLIVWGYRFMHVARRNGDTLEKLYEGKIQDDANYVFRQITPDSLLLYNKGLISLHDPSNPEILWQAPLCLHFQSIIVDTLLLVGTVDHMIIFNISNPREPVIVDTLEGSWARSNYSYNVPKAIGNTVAFFNYDRVNFIRLEGETPEEYETYEWRAGFPGIYVGFWGDIVHDSLFAFAAFKDHGEGPICVQYFDPDRSWDHMDILQVEYRDFYRPANNGYLVYKDWAVDDSLLMIGRSPASRTRLYNIADLDDEELLIDTVIVGKRPCLLNTDEHLGLFQYGNRGYLNLRTGGEPEFTISPSLFSFGMRNDLRDSLHFGFTGDTTVLYEIAPDSVIQRCNIAGRRHPKIIPHETYDLVVSADGDSVSIFNCEEDSALHVSSTRWDNATRAVYVACDEDVVIARFDSTITSWILNEDLTLTFVDSIALDWFYSGIDLYYDYPYIGCGKYLFCLDDSFRFVDRLSFEIPTGYRSCVNIVDIYNDRVVVTFTRQYTGLATVVFDISERSVTDTLAHVYYGSDYSYLDGDTLWVASYYCLTKYILTEFSDVPGLNHWSNDSAVPITFELLPAWPNPFNSTVSIPFTLPASCAVMVSVHDILGRQVALVTDEVYPSGYNVVRFSPTSLSSGTYFATMSTPYFHQTRRLILLK